MRIARHLGAHCIDKWNRWQLDPSLDTKTQSNMAKINAMQSLSLRKCFYLHQLQKLTNFPQSLWSRQKRKGLLASPYWTLCFFLLRQLIFCSSQKNMTQKCDYRWRREELIEKGREQQDRHLFQRAEVYHPGQDFHWVYHCFLCLELRSIKKMFLLWISNEFPLNL